MLGIDIAKKYIGLQEVRDRVQIQTLLKSQAKAGDISINPAQIPWCAAFVNFCERSAGNPGNGRLNARSFLKYGSNVEPDDSKPGDIVIFDFERDGIHGHVGYLVSWDDKNNLVKCLGGNQSNSVCYANYIQDYICGIRRFK